MAHTFIIAEMGSTWAGNLLTACTLIRAVAQAGADAAKVQWVSDPTRMAARRNAPELAEMYRTLNWPAEWHLILAKECAHHGLKYLSSVYLPEDAAMLAPHVSLLKISSFEAQDQALIQACRLTGKPLIVSTGMQDGVAPYAGWNYVSYLHCVSAYPCPMDQLNLACIRKEGLDGLSDHTGNVLTGALAVAAGATILEVHVRPDGCPPSNPDYPHSLSLEQFRQYVANVQWAELAMGDGSKRVQECERPNLRYRVGGGA